MIAAALRTEIDLFWQYALERSEMDTLARCAVATQRLAHGVGDGSGDDSLPSMRAMAELLDRAALAQPAALLAYRALAEHLVAQALPSSAASAAREQALDSIDDLVEDPADLPVLRTALSTFCGHFHRLCQEATRAPRRRADLTASAA